MAPIKDSIFNSIHNISLLLSKRMSFQEIYKDSVEMAVILAGAEQGILLVKNGKKYHPAYMTSENLGIDTSSLKGLMSGRDIRVINGSNISKHIKDSHGFHSVVCVPVGEGTGNKVVILLFAREKKYFNERKKKELEIYSSLLNLAFKNVQLQEERNKAIEEKEIHAGLEHALTKIHESAIKFLMPLTPEETFKTIVEEAIKLVNGNYGSLTLEDGNGFKQVYSTLPIRVKRRNRGFTYKSFKESKVYMIQTEGSQEFAQAHPEFEKIGIKSILFIPLSYKNRSIGVLVVNSIKKKHFTHKELNILLPFGSLASLAIKKSHLNSELNTAIQMRDLFISMAAHELRTPMTAINGYTQLLNKKVVNISESQSNWIRSLHVESSRLTSLINDLLEISRIQSGKLQYDFEECSVLDILNNVIDIFTISYPERKIIFENKLEPKVLIIADRDRITQALLNILENAVKFSPREKIIRIFLESNNSNLIMSFQDEGKGIGKSEIKRVFERYYRGSNNSVEGMGLGLYLVLNVIKAHHGKIRVSSRINRGTTIQIKLPRVKV